MPANDPSPGETWCSKRDIHHRVVIIGQVAAAVGFRWEHRTGEPSWLPLGEFLDEHGFVSGASNGGKAPPRASEEGEL